jgi:hypothetical protein
MLRSSLHGWPRQLSHNPPHPKVCSAQYFNTTYPVRHALSDGTQWESHAERQGCI